MAKSFNGRALVYIAVKLLTHRKLIFSNKEKRERKVRDNSRKLILKTLKDLIANPIIHKYPT